MNLEANLNKDFKVVFSRICVSVVLSDSKMAKFSEQNPDKKEVITCD